jgi:hypothetical protein
LVGRVKELAISGALDLGHMLKTKYLSTTDTLKIGINFVQKKPVIS